MIINLDDSSGPGTHWVALTLDKHQLTYFDPFGAQIPDTIITYTKKSTKPVRWNTSQIQSMKSDACGYYCMYFIRESRKRSPEEAIFDFDPDPTTRNENKIRQYFKQFQPVSPH